MEVLTTHVAESVHGCYYLFLCNLKWETSKSFIVSWLKTPYRESPDWATMSQHSFITIISTIWRTPWWRGSRPRHSRRWSPPCGSPRAACWWRWRWCPPPPRPLPAPARCCYSAANSSARPPATCRQTPGKQLLFHYVYSINHYFKLTLSCRRHSWITSPMSW